MKTVNMNKSEVRIIDGGHPAKLINNKDCKDQIVGRERKTVVPERSWNAVKNILNQNSRSKQAGKENENIDKRIGKIQGGVSRNDKREKKKRKDQNKGEKNQERTRNRQ